ncbi:cytochrome P450 monooxygenase-like protein [Xylaria bambusicola]|uniref:cytochrome P450 monooxygenase-like protein n=1 Tax=Xylaria bambusicola TaxID=326684 RepID=UPI00200814B3|nr:cytochrome P450 monooxygenase-like protein [Xylaria bambusicola]KAI0506267.1 cytochrome P450 monooxygenase-like protein [Xylaria bambusicola]
MSANLTNVLATASGISTHVLVFRVGEWDVVSHFVLIFYLFRVPIFEAVKFAGCHIFGLYLSILVYRVFYHRLSKYPGPFLARLTNFYITKRSIKKLHLFEEIRKLHEEYGDYVRVGPSELSIADPEAVLAIHGYQSPTTKGPWYTLLEPRAPLNMIRDKEEHARRRKVWDQGFSTKALLGYDPRITIAISQLLNVINKQRSKPIDITKWFTFFTFDIMESLAFNKSSNMLAGGNEGYALRSIRGEVYNLAFFSHLPWLLPFLKRIPLLNHSYLQFWAWVQDQINERAKDDPDQPDIFSWLLEAYNKSAKTRKDRFDLHGDAHVIIIAGSDTVAAALTHVFFHLAHDPMLVRALQREFDALPDLTSASLQTVNLLDAVINETLRLHPPVPSGNQRVTPPEGLRIGNKFIPGNTIVQVPQYTVFRDPRVFDRPLEFIPDRWTTRPELINYRSAFIPFGSGPFGCIGKRLALIEIRRVVAEIVSRYDMKPAPEHNKEAFLDGKKDTHTLVSGPLHLIFVERVSLALPGASQAL